MYYGAFNRSFFLRWAKQCQWEQETRIFVGAISLLKGVTVYVCICAYIGVCVRVCSRLVINRSRHVSSSHTYTVVVEEQYVLAYLQKRRNRILHTRAYTYTLCSRLRIAVRTIILSFG